MGYEFLTHAATELVCISCRSPRTKWCEVFNRLILKLRRQSACTEAIYDNLRESLSGLKSWLWWGKRFKTSKDRTSLSFINIHLIVIRSKESSSKSSSSTFKHFLFSMVHRMSSFPVTNYDELIFFKFFLLHHQPADSVQQSPPVEAIQEHPDAFMRLLQEATGGALQPQAFLGNV